MDFRILGPVEVHDGDGPLATGGAKPRALLAILLLHANEVVSNDRLIDALWGERPPETAAKALQVHVSQLRKAIGASAIRTRPPGYVLEVGGGDLDLDRFEQMHEAARGLLATDPAEARRLLRDALELWRGPPLADLAYEPFAQAEIARLEEMRVAAVEDRIEADLALGRHAEVVGELERLIAEHPHRERLRGQLMLALYRSGRQAEALDAYQAARAALTDELGIEPGHELRDIQQAILGQHPDLDLRPVPQATSDGGSRGVFVGRERELAELVSALESALAGRGQLVLLAGEPGIGKSRLADELMGQARARGAQVLVGRCWEAGGAPAYWPWVQALRVQLRESEPDALRAELGLGAADLAHLLPELRPSFPDASDSPSSDSEGARFRLFDAVSSFLRNAARVRPLVLVLDDLHAADEPSLLLLQFLTREIADCPLLIVCAFRDVDPTLQAPLVSTLAEVVREAQTRQVVLAGLDEAAVANYVELSTGIEAPPALIRAIHAETEGNPLFVAEVVRLLATDGHLTAADSDVRIPAGVRAVIGQRVARLPKQCRDLLVRAAVLGREFGLDALARLGGLSHEELLDVLDEAMAERVLADVPGAPTRLRFGHALIRDTLYDELTSARRMRLHQDAAAALEAVYSDDLEPHLTELAHHFFVAAPAGMADRAIDYARRAGDRAVSQFAYEEGVRLYEMALTLADDDVTRCELLLGSGEAQARAGDTPASKLTHRAAAELARKMGLPDQLARAALGYGGRMIWEVSRDDEYLAPLLEGAIAALGDADSSLRARLMTRLAAGPLRDLRFPPERQRSLGEEALEMARRIGDPATLVYAIDGYIPAVESPANTREMLELSTELLGLATTLGDRERMIEALEHRIGRLIELGRMPEARADVESLARFAGELRQPAQQWLAGVCAARLDLLDGRLARAERLIEESLRLGERAQSWNAAVAYRLQLYLLRREQGRIAEVSELVRHSAEEYATYSVWRCVSAQVSAALGLTAEARDAVEALAEDDFAGVRFGEMWLVSLGCLAEATSSIDDARRAATLYELLLPYADRVAVTYPEISTGSVARYLGLLAATREHWSDAERHFKSALAVHEQMGALPWLALTQRDYARMLVSRNVPGDRKKAESLAARATTIGQAARDL
jgi:DNA-binding SARP family transcriptional activator